MPAYRSRTEQWRKGIEQVLARGGALEISIPQPGVDAAAAAAPASDPVASNLVWRVRILALNENDLVVEAPSTLGQTINIDPGIQLIAVLAIGQNRWMFATSILERLSQPASSGPHRAVSALRLACPDSVERCQRRSHYRVAAMQLNLPSVSCWPLLDPESAIIAEKANEIHIASSLDAISPRAVSSSSSSPSDNDPDRLTLPVVGPLFHATLANIGGGGIGLILDPGDARGLQRKRVFWLHIPLPPEIPVPLGVTAKLVHTHIDSTQKTYAGLAFEFSHNPAHQRFIIDQLTRYVVLRQKSLRIPTPLRRAS